MLDDDFKKIEDFLKAGGNSELQTFQAFEDLVNDFVKNKFKDDIKEGFITLHQLIYHSYGEFDKNNSNVIKDFAITIIIIKNLLATLKTVQDDTILSEEDKKVYITVMKVLVNSIKQESESHLNFFKIFSEYVNDIASLFSVED